MMPPRPHLPPSPTLPRPAQALFRRAQLKALVGLHAEGEGLGGTLSVDEIAIIGGALDLTHKTAWAAMTPLDKVGGAALVGAPAGGGGGRAHTASWAAMTPLDNVGGARSWARGGGHKVPGVGRTL